MKKLFYFFLCLFLSSQFSLRAQNTQLKITMEWESTPSLVQVFGNTEMYTWTFKGASVSPSFPEFPVYNDRILIDRPSQANITVSQIHTTEIDLSLAAMKDSLPDNIEIWNQVVMERRQHYLVFGFIPLYKNGNTFYRIDSLMLNISLTPSIDVTSRSSFGNNSVLRNGDFFKMAVYQTGIHRIDHGDLTRLGISPGAIDPRNIKIYSNGGGMLPEPNNADRVDDLVELAIWIQGEADGRFDQGDYILFYAEGPDKWEHNIEAGKTTLIKNIYDKANHFFITVSPGQGKRISVRENDAPGTYVTDEFDDVIRFEEDKVNIGHLSNFTSGGGKNWYGDVFRNQREREYSNVFNFPGLVTNVPIKVEAIFAGRCGTSSRFFVEVDGQTLQSTLISGTNLGNSESVYANLGTINGQVTINHSNPSVKIRYPEVSGQFSEGWLDFIEINARRKIQFNGTPMVFRDYNSVSQSLVTYQITASSTNGQIWDITNPFEPELRSVPQTGNQWNLHVQQNGLKEFIIFQDNTSLPRPLELGKITNQNLHNISKADLLIIYFEQFETEALRLADFRRSFSGLAVETAEISQVYNEFSGGSLDPTAIRDFARMLYERDPNFKYLLLFGDASFDFRSIIIEESNNRNYIPAWQTPNSLDPINTFPTDDYYALLDPDEGGTLRGAIDIAVGRLPVGSIQEARILVDKIIKYESDPGSFGDWRMNFTMFADDGDGNIHIRDADNIARATAQQYSMFNIDKIFFDAFPRIITPGGARFPAAKEAINTNMFKGQLFFNYLGHGGATGLAQERVVTLDDIASWNNRDKLTLFITATCTFAPYDDPTRTSAGEQTLLNPNGGAVGLMTTTRAVYAHSNARLTSNVFRHLFEKVNGTHPPIGEILRLGKNTHSADTTSNNARKFTLLGDPTTQLAIPKYGVKTLTINGKPVDPDQPDTLKAMGKYTITGMIVNDNGQLLESFNGSVNPTIFDKVLTLTTLGQGPGSSPFDYEIQRNVLFKGAATVSNGMFSFTFIMPKNINYEIGRGKISYYAHDGLLTDAGGYDSDILIGGTASGTALSDTPPIVELYMNSENFAFGGITDPNPVLYGKLQAENGINFTGNSIGHDITGILNEDDQNSFILNDFYESELDDFTRGTIRYPLSNLSPGLHKIKVKAYDIINKSGEGYVEFIVVNDEDFVIKNLYNYPNPFNRNTSIQFEHNYPFQMMDIQVLIYTVAGRIVKSIEQRIMPTDYLIRDIQWDGLDDYGQRLANGVYLYKVKVSLESPDGNRKTTESDFQKMVILN
jgi:hypothetical protein